MAFISASANGFSIKRDNRPFLPVAFQPVVEAFRQRFGIELVKNSPKRVAVRYPVRQREEASEPFLSSLAERLHIDKVISVAQQGTQSYDENVFQLMANVSTVCPTGAFHICHRFFQFPYPDCITSYRHMSEF